MKELLVGLLSWIAANSPYDIPDKMPAIEFQPAGFFEPSSCSSKIHCAARAYYEDGSHTIVLHEVYRDPQSARARSMLVHEIVHYLQDLSGRWAEKNCSIWIEREREAFRLQYLYLVKETGNYHLYMPVLDTKHCTDR